MVKLPFCHVLIILQLMVNLSIGTDVLLKMRLFSAGFFHLQSLDGANMFTTTEV